MLCLKKLIAETQKGKRNEYRYYDIVEKCHEYFSEEVLCKMGRHLKKSAVLAVK